jgi:hexosaminidase
MVEYMTFPRACALAEVAWTMPENKGRQDFMKRLEVHERRLDLLDVNYRK